MIYKSFYILAKMWTLLYVLYYTCTTCISICLISCICQAPLNEWLLYIEYNIIGTTATLYPLYVAIIYTIFHYSSFRAVASMLLTIVMVSSYKVEGMRGRRNRIGTLPDDITILTFMLNWVLAWTSFFEAATSFDFNSALTLWLTLCSTSRCVEELSNANIQYRNAPVPRVVVFAAAAAAAAAATAA